MIDRENVVDPREPTNRSAQNLNARLQRKQEKHKAHQLARQLTAAYGNNSYQEFPFKMLRQIVRENPDFDLGNSTDMFALLQALSVMDDTYKEHAPVVQTLQQCKPVWENSRRRLSLVFVASALALLPSNALIAGDLNEIALMDTDIHQQVIEPEQLTPAKIAERLGLELP